MSTNPWGIQIRMYEGETQDGLFINIFMRVPQGGVVHLEDTGWKHYEEFVSWSKPTMYLPGPDAIAVQQQLVNILAERGMVPTATKDEVNDLQRTLAAKDAHIADLQKILKFAIQPPTHRFEGSA